MSSSLAQRLNTLVEVYKNKKINITKIHLVTAFSIAKQYQNLCADIARQLNLLLDINLAQQLDAIWGMFSKANAQPSQLTLKRKHLREALVVAINYKDLYLNLDQQLILEAPVQKHRLEFYRDMMQKVCQGVNTSLDSSYFEVVARFFQLGDISLLSRDELCKKIRYIQNNDNVEHLCRNHVDAFSQDDIDTIPHPFLIHDDEGFCFNILDLATNSEVSKFNPYTRKAFSKEFTEKIHQKLADLEKVLMP